MFSSSDLDELVAIEAPSAVSLYLPTHMAGRETRQDPIRLKNLLAEAAARLGATRRGPEVEALLAPARALLDDDAFWQHQQQGLAIFLAPGFERIHKLPIAVAEELVLGRYFHIKPLLPLLDDAGPFWLLAISGSHTRLFEGSRWDFTECGGLDLPQGVAAVRDETEYQETHYPGPAGGTVVHAQVLGDTPAEIRKTELIELLRRVAAAVEPSVKRHPAPVVIAADPEIRGHFREIAGWKEIWPDDLKENPDALGDEELHRRAYALIEPKLALARAAALEHLAALRGTGKTAVEPEDIVRAARHGRIDTLFVSGDEHLWGRLDETADRIVADQGAAEDGIDLLDYAALMTLRQGGRVMVVDRAALPPPGLAAAVLRY